MIDRRNDSTANEPTNACADYTHGQLANSCARAHRVCYDFLSFILQVLTVDGDRNLLVSWARNKIYNIFGFFFSIEISFLIIFYRGEMQSKQLSVWLASFGQWQSQVLTPCLFFKIIDYEIKIIKRIQILKWV